MHRKYLKWVQETGSSECGNYNPQRKYKLGISTESFQGEANLFFVLNFKGWGVPTSTAFYIESKTDGAGHHTQLARKLLEKSGILNQNVELLGNQLSNNSAKMVTFGTLVEAIKIGFPSVTEDDSNDVLDNVVQFIDRLHKARPNEIAVLSVAKSQKARLDTVADQAVIWHGYIRLAYRLRNEFGDEGLDRLDMLTVPTLYESSEEDDDRVKTYNGDPFGRVNPAWRRHGVVSPGKTGWRVVNNRQFCDGAFTYLCELVWLGVKGPRGTQAV